VLDRKPSVLEKYAARIINAALDSCVFSSSSSSFYVSCAKNLLFDNFRTSKFP
jgi:hypothetical protein